MLSSDAFEDQADAASELNDVYSDLIGLAEGTDLSAAFTTNPENLELLQRVMEGDIKAYDELAARAAQDILIQAGVDTDTAQADIAYLQQLINESNYNEIEIGAHVDSTALEEELNNIIAAAGMTAAEAESLLAAMGLEAELETATETAEDPITYTGLQPVPTGPVPITSTFPVGEGGKITTESSTAYVSGVTMEPQPATTMQSRAMTAFGLKVRGTATGATSGGGVKIKQGSIRKAATGAAKYANASHGGGYRHPTSSGGGGGGSCFVAGTPVRMCGYFQNIEDVKVGNIVLSYNEKLKCNQYSVVLQTMIHDTTEILYTLYIENEQLTVTGIHKFLIIHHGKKEWIQASDLRINDLVLFADGTWHRISNITTELQTTTVYNFEVSRNHNYYVGANQILAHNKGGGGSGKGDKAEEPKDVAHKEAQEKEKEIYEKIDAWLEKLQDDYSKLEKIRKRTWSRETVKRANQELGLLKAQAKALQERIKISEEYAQALLGDEGLKNKYNVKNSLNEYGLTDVDLDGIVDNYSQQ